MTRTAAAHPVPDRRADPADLARRRLHAQAIAAPLREAGEVVERLGAVQAQDYLAALWAVGVRLEGATEADVERALARGVFLRTWPMRGTLHFVPSRDARWMLRLLAPRVLARAAPRHRELELDAATFARAGKVLERALRGGGRLTRPAAFALLQRSGVSTAGQRGIHIVQRLALDGLLCFGPREGKQHTLVLLDEWVPAPRTLAREEALAEIAVRYFAGHGPATAADLRWWAGLPAAEAREALDLAAPRLESERFRGATYWASTSPAGTRRRAARGAFLLPAFDELVVGYADRSALLDDPRDAVRIGAGGMLSPTLVVDGRIVGTWRRRLVRGGVSLEAAPFGRLGADARRALGEARERYAAFLGVAAVASRRERGRFVARGAAPRK